MPDTAAAARGIDDSAWERLRAAARDARDLAYAPYSRHPVGAAALTDDGRIVTGSNVENASLGVTLCAECALVGDLVRTGRPGDRGSIVAITCVGPSEGPLLPCGRCRQLLVEHGGGGILVDRTGGPVPLALLLPDAFGPEQLP